MINNYSTESILKALRSGISCDEIANSISSMLTDANKTYKAEVEEAKRKAEKKKAEEKRRTDLAKIIADLLDFVDYYYYEITEDVDETELAEEILNTFDLLGDLADKRSVLQNFDFHSLFSTSDRKER